MPDAIEVVEIVSGKVVHSVDTRGKSDRDVERAMAGMLINIDRSRFLVRAGKEVRR